MSSPIIIIGGGITGLCIAWNLIRQNQDVTVIEKRRLPDGSSSVASGAAAGMISPVGELSFQEEYLQEIYRQSHQLWPHFIHQLGVTDEELDFYREGTLFTALDDDDKNELCRLYDHQKQLGMDVTVLDTESSLKLEPHLSSRQTMAVWAKNEYSINAHKLLSLLKKQFESLGGQYIECHEVESIQANHGQVSAITVSDLSQLTKQKINTSRVVMASGLNTITCDDPLNIPLRPVKGQALELLMTEHFKIKRTIRSIHKYPAYLVPRNDGRLIVGATSEEMGMNDDPTAGSLLDLLYAAWKIFPATYEMKFLSTWTGLRPATKDHAPVLGETDIKGLFLAMGLYRHGYLMAPLVGTVLSQMVLGTDKPSWIDRYSHKRFQRNPL